MLKLAEAMAVIPLVKRALPEARLPMQDAKTLGRDGRGRPRRHRDPQRRGATGGEEWRPGIRPRSSVGGPGREAAVALLSLAPALMALRSGDLAAYHGVEHKSIAAYEEDSDAADATKEHDRCGSHLVAPMLTAAALGNVAARRAGLRGPAADAAVGLGSAAVAVEIFVWGEKPSRTRRSRACCAAPVNEIQRVVGTREPTAEQLEVGRAALAEILRVEGLPAGPAR